MLAAPLSLRLFTVIASLVVAAGLIFVSNATYARKETVSGWLSPEGGLVRVTARQGGQIVSLDVVENALVSKGQILATLQLSSEGETGDFGQVVAGDITAEGLAESARAQAQRARLVAEREQLSSQRRAMQDELGESRDRIDLQLERVAIAQADFDRAEQISERGFLPRRELDARRSTLLEARGDLSEIRASASVLEREIGGIDGRLRTLPAELQAIDAGASASQASLNQRRTENASTSAYRTVAPFEGRVAAIPVRRGQTLAAGATIAVLTPIDGALEAELYVPSSASGFIRAGQDVRLMYQAFPYQKFGTAKGVVTSVSATVLSPDEVTFAGGQITEPVFRVRASLERSTVEAYGDAIALRPGMLLTADVIVDRRTLLEWLLDPLYAAGRGR